MAISNDGLPNSIFTVTSEFKDDTASSSSGWIWKDSTLSRLPARLEKRGSCITFDQAVAPRATSILHLFRSLNPEAIAVSKENSAPQLIDYLDITEVVREDKLKEFQSNFRDAFQQEPVIATKRTAENTDKLFLACVRSIKPTDNFVVSTTIRPPASTVYVDPLALDNMQAISDFLDIKSTQTLSSLTRSFYESRKELFSGKENAIARLFINQMIGKKRGKDFDIAKDGAHLKKHLQQINLDYVTSLALFGNFAECSFENPGTINISISSQALPAFTEILKTTFPSLRELALSILQGEGFPITALQALPNLTKLSIDLHRKVTAAKITDKITAEELSELAKSLP